MTLSSDIDAKIRKSFSLQGLMARFEAELMEVSDGRVVVSAPISPSVSQQHGAAHAGLTFALGDTAAGYAALSKFPLESEVLTVEMKINLMRPAFGDRLVAEGSVIKAGRKLSVVQARVFAETGAVRKEIALLQGTMIPA